ncbi:MAG: hypothetical protein ACREQY_04510 [Candidatus Binatia bacterium]
MIELLLPRTDAGVAVQVAVTLAVGIPVVVSLARRRSHDLVWFVGGLGLLLLGFFAFRAVH